MSGKFQEKLFSYTIKSDPMLKCYFLLTLFIFSAFWSFSSTCPISIQGENWICPGETTVLTASGGFSEYYWSNGQKGQSIAVEPGSYKVVGRTEEGCLGVAEFSVSEIKLPQSYGLKILGGSRVEGDNWVENRYTFHPYNERLEYTWMLDGAAIGQGPLLEMETLPIRTYQLQLTAFSPCTGQSVSTFVLLQPHGGSADSTTVYSCSPEGPYYYFSVPFFSPGLYDIVSVNQVGFQIAVRRNLLVETQYSETYDTVILCGNTPISYYGTAISQAGSYDVPFRNNFGCQELIHLEALGPVDQALSLETITQCGGGGFEHNGELYTAPGLYEESYPTAGGCDSLAFTFVEYVEEPPASEVHAEICPGSVYEHDGVSYQAEGIYVRTYTLANGCDSTLTIYLSYQEVPTGETHHYFCHGGSFEFNGEVFTESTVFEYLSPGQGGACDSFITAYVWELDFIEVEEQLLTPDDGSGSGAIELIIQGGRPPYAYQWSNGAATQNLSGLSAGSYTLTVTDDTGCAASFIFELGLLSGASSREAAFGLALGPNPFREELRLFGQASLPSGNITLYLYDATGRLAVSLPFSEDRATPPANLPGGLYWYRLESEGKLLSAGKIVRQ